MNIMSSITPAQDAGKAEQAGRETAQLGHLLAEWSRLHLAMAMPRYSRSVEQAYYQAAYDLGVAQARVMGGDLPSFAEESAEFLRVYFNHDPVGDCVWDEGEVG